MFTRASIRSSCATYSLFSVESIKCVRYKSRSTVGLKAGTKKEPVPAPADGQLPPLEEWKDRFYYNGVVKKPTLHNLTTARKLVQGFGIADATTPKVVLEAFAGSYFSCDMKKMPLTLYMPGPGTLSRALCELPESKMSKLIILEDNPLYLPYLEVRKNVMVIF